MGITHRRSVSINLPDRIELYQSTQRSGALAYSTSVSLPHRIPCRTADAFYRYRFPGYVHRTKLVCRPRGSSPSTLFVFCGPFDWLPPTIKPCGDSFGSILLFDPQVHRPSVLITSPTQSIRFFFILLKITNRSPKWPACTCILIATEQGGRIPTRNGGESKIRTTYTDRRGRDMRAVMTWPIDRV